MATNNNNNNNYYYCYEGIERSTYEERQQNNIRESTYDDYDEYPWTKPTKFEPTPGQNESLELFISEVENYLFLSNTKRTVKDNMTSGQRKALKALGTWNKDPSNPRMFRIQDKGSRLVIEWKHKYKEGILKYLEDINIFKEENDNPCNRNLQKVKNWTIKWYDECQIGEEEREWITSVNSKPAKIHANIKTHKRNWPYRYIISCIGTPIENLAKWVEYHLKLLSRQHKAYIKDTTHFLNYLEDVNISKGPFNADSVLLVTRDIANFYPSCDTQKCLQAVQTLLDAREIRSPSTECILEALKITMSSNSTEFDSRFFTQIDGATIGSPDSGSVTDIFGAMYIDNIIEESCPIKPEHYVRYRHDTFDVCINSNEAEQEEVTKWMDENIYKGKIKFEMKCNTKELEFLDTKVTLRPGKENGDEESRVYLVPAMYSKPTDTHQYPNPNSCHSPHITRNLPSSIVSRVRRNCSDN